MAVIGGLSEFAKRLTEINTSDLPQGVKDTRLAVLMSDMEGTYNIPTISTKLRQEFEYKQPQVMSLYRMVSDSRSF
ncbi:hypothetical protein KO561_13050 [Radiobacillus kanasensis]|uniref:hypothetical protein n=1 Tax=Radiobacillus kanasensis TaxID=2844358 RepID=UPI001E3F5E6E|nr:hypothetical protein [Radiobacillus kanasensis]UFT98130.1 hypothetical protein KO561_13050 [Radiobacillus kanasensis]